MSSRIVNQWATLPVKNLWRGLVHIFGTWPIPRYVRGRLVYWLLGGWALELLLLTIYVWCALLWITLALGWLVFGTTVGLVLRLVSFRWPRRTPPTRSMITDAE